jgi:hypothetical protein
MKRKEAVFISVQALVVIAVLALVALPLQSVNNTAPATSASSSQALQLRLSDNASSLVVGQALHVNISLFNTLPTVNDVHTSDDWPFQGVYVALWPGCVGPPPAFAVVLVGNYTMQSLPAVADATFGIGYVCSAGVRVDHIIFQPGSSEAKLRGIYSQGGNQTLGPFELSANFTTTGYWELANNSQILNSPVIGANPPSPPIATPFVPGVYTVAVADEWGEATILHFTVSYG